MPSALYNITKTTSLKQLATPFSVWLTATTTDQSPVAHCPKLNWRPNRHYFVTMAIIYIIIVPNTFNINKTRQLQFKHNSNSILKTRWVFPVDKFSEPDMELGTKSRTRQSGESTNLRNKTSEWPLQKNA